MDLTTITLHSRFRIEEVDPRVFGGFLEHMGRAVYQGVYDPTSAHADAHGFRQDVLSALRRLRMTVMRYPGGNFASGYHWQDGVGPRHSRPATLDLAWNSVEPNHFGTDEFVTLCRQMGWSPMITVNLGTGSPEEARDWVEYCNADSDTRFARLRRQNGHPQPHDVRLWCLGNEMDGPWQLGHAPAEHYAVRALQAAKMMKAVDQRIELVVCGSSSVRLPTYLEWDRKVLAYVGDAVDYISLHRYVGNPDDDTLDYLAVTNAIDRQIEETDAVCRCTVRNKRVYLAFDEWNVWYKDRRMDGERTTAPHLIEEVYNLEDALVVAGFLNSFIRHADVVKIANLAQIVNVIAPVLTRGDDMLIQSIFYPFEMFSRRRTGVALRAVVEGPSYMSKTSGAVHFVDFSAIYDGNRLHCFAVNRCPNEAAIVQVVLADRSIVSLESAEVLTGSHAKAHNTFAHPDVVRAAPFDAASVRSGAAWLELPPLSLVASTWRV